MLRVDRSSNTPLNYKILVITFVSSYYYVPEWFEQRENVTQSLYGRRDAKLCLQIRFPAIHAIRKRSENQRHYVIQLGRLACRDVAPVSLEDMKILACIAIIGSGRSGPLTDD